MPRSGVNLSLWPESARYTLINEIWIFGVPFFVHDNNQTISKVMMVKNYITQYLYK